MLPTPQPVPGQLTSPRASKPEVTSEDILRAFLEGARLDIRREEIRELTTMFRGIGEIVRESFEGAGNFLRSQGLSQNRAAHRAHRDRPAQQQPL